MARVSFTLGRATGDLGSYVRYDDKVAYRVSAAGGPSAGAPAGARTDYDSALRDDGLQAFPSTFTQSFFEATSVSYGEALLTWGVTLIDPKNPLTPLTTIPQPIEVLIVYSPLGEPQTINSGEIIAESGLDYTKTMTGLTEGHWAYFSMFVHFQDIFSPGYYERTASLAILIPKNYGSNLLLWNRIPEYYRNQDTALGDTNFDESIGTLPPGGIIGPLYKYLSIIGFDMDRIRTYADYNMVAQDPSLASTETLDALATQMAVPLKKSDLGGQRLRALMDNIGFFRRSKGTEIGTEFFGKAISGSDVAIDPVNNTINVYSQRVNYITVPKNGLGITTHRAANITEVAAPQAFSFDTSAHSGSYTAASVSHFIGTSASAGGWTDVMIHLSSPVPVQLGDTVNFSVHGNIGPHIKWARLVDSLANTLGTQDVPVSASGSRVFEVNVTSNASVGLYINSYVEYLVDLSSGPFINELLLAERNYVGPYFDGGYVRGGWLIDASSVSDYRWAGSKDASVSLYAEDYQRTQKIVASLLPGVLPINRESGYNVSSYHAYVTASNTAKWDVDHWDGHTKKWG